MYNESFSDDDDDKPPLSISFFPAIHAMRQRGLVIPTEIIGFHGGFVGLLVLTAIVRPPLSAWRVTLWYVGVSIILYWSVLVFLRWPQRLTRWWFAQVTNRSKARFSTGVLIVFVSTLNLFLLFGALVIASAHVLFFIEQASSHTWDYAFCISLSAMGIKGYDQFLPTTDVGPVVCALVSLLGLVFTALWVTVFMKAFDAIFQFRRNEL
jgi:hypothetical protein